MKKQFNKRLRLGKMEIVNLENIKAGHGTGNSIVAFSCVGSCVTMISCEPGQVPGCEG